MVRPVFAAVVLVLLCGSVRADSLSVEVITFPPDEPGLAILAVDAVTPEIGGYSFGVLIPDGLSFSTYDPALDPEFVGVQLQADVSGLDDFAGIGVIFSTSPTVVTHGPGLLRLGSLAINLPPAGLAAGESAPILLVDGFGSPPISLEFATTVGAVMPTPLSGGILAASAPQNRIWVASPTDNTIVPVIPGEAPAIPIVDPPVLNGDNLMTPVSVAVDPNGILWASYQDEDLVRRFDADGQEIFVVGGSNRIETGVGSLPGAIAIGRFGNAWIANTGTASITVVNPFGQILFGAGGAFGEIGLEGRTPVALASDPAGSMWIAATMGTDGTLFRVNRSGVKAPKIVSRPGGAALPAPSAIAVDRQGFAWVCYSDDNSVERRSSDGSLSNLYQDPELTLPRSIAIRRRPQQNGKREAWVIGGSSSEPTLHRIRPEGDLDHFTALGSVDFTSLTVDGLGQVWLTRADGMLELLDADVDPPASPLTGIVAAVGSAPTVLGDATGYQQAAFRFLDGDPAATTFFDFDEDGYVNVAELDNGSNVFDADSVPSEVIPVQGLQCATSSGIVTLTWTNPSDVDPLTPLTAEPYDSIDVLVDGVVQTSLSGTEVTTNLTAIGAGEHQLAVIGLFGGSGEESMCFSVIGPGEVLDTDEVSDPDGELLNPFGVAAVSPPPTNPAEPAIYVADPESRLIAALNAEGSILSTISTDALGLFDGGFGPTGCAYVPAVMPGELDSLFVVGGNSDEPTEIHEIQIDASGNPSVGTTSIFPVQNTQSITGDPGGMAARRTTDGLNIILLFAGGPGGCEIFAVLASSVDGEIIPGASFEHPNGGAGQRAVALTAFQEYDVNGGQVWVSELFDPVEGLYQMVEVVVPGASPFGPGLQTSTATGNRIPLTALREDNVLGGVDFLVDAGGPKPVTLEAVGITTSTINRLDAPTLSEQYVSGDANRDFGIDIADPITMLGILFSGGEQIQCDAALDPNADGALNIADAIYVLSFLFAGGDAPQGYYPASGGEPFECILPATP